MVLLRVEGTTAQPSDEAGAALVDGATGETGVSGAGFDASGAVVGSIGGATSAGGRVGGASVGTAAVPAGGGPSPQNE